jgi:hypothetical protein
MFTCTRSHCAPTEKLCREVTKCSKPRWIILNTSAVGRPIRESMNINSIHCARRATRTSGKCQCSSVGGRAKSGIFGSPMWDPFPRCEIKPLTRQRLTATVPKTANAKPSRSQALQHFAHHRTKQDVQNSSPAPQSPTPTPLLQCRLVHISR